MCSTVRLFRLNVWVTFMSRNIDFWMRSRIRARSNYRRVLIRRSRAPDGDAWPIPPAVVSFWSQRVRCSRFRYLDGRTQDGFVQTVGDSLPPFSGTRWNIQEMSPEKCHHPVTGRLSQSGARISGWKNTGQRRFRRPGAAYQSAVQRNEMADPRASGAVTAGGNHTERTSALSRSYCRV